MPVVQEKEALLSKVDFVYQGEDSSMVLISDSSFTASNVAFTLKGEATTEVTAYFRRIKDTGVLTYLSGTGITKAVLGSGTTVEAKDSSCTS